ncbi:hypothetical protein [Mycolicibacterium litorale]|uniref:Uncharacterized protein n=1 Tax=Mycolicibacterium litorale TaxID=758802 RepID=A0AAD1MTP8_9MYCO|nr:hypothetical protein [Mycolicibacterium litorale]MCV7415677.1 hypothetical protein [Mycolicibacterium litorale]TDY08932.1 hypothetical protein BCL50_1007 [Mycolicibacterium litorale]BBY16860.1 hypothetical protein MLIT_24520 [Mycolicibacterium litorale]
MKKAMVGYVGALMLVWGGLVVAPAVSNAQNCQWDAAWFFGVGCTPLGPPSPPSPPESQPYHPVRNPQGHAWSYEMNGIHWCSPETPSECI